MKSRQNYWRTETKTRLAMEKWRSLFVQKRKCQNWDGYAGAIDEHYEITI